MAETYDAITSNRPYHLGRSDGDARAEILRHVGTQHDPEVVKAFFDIPEKEWVCAAVLATQEDNETEDGLLSGE